MTSQFLTELQVQYLGGGWWKLLAPLVYYSERLQRVIIVPAGFCTDFETIKRLPIIYWWFKNRAIPESVIHDWLWRTDLVGRVEADKVFMEAMKVRGKWMITRGLMGGAVLAAGLVLYNPRPGCMDYRGCSLGAGGWCFTCPTYQQGWSKTVMLPGEYNEFAERNSLPPLCSDAFGMCNDEWERVTVP